MGTEIALSFSSLRTQLENEKSSLFKIDESIKKIIQITGRAPPNERFNPVGEYARAHKHGGRSYTDTGNNYKNDEQFGKRKPETKTVFSRLSARVHGSDDEDDGPGTKRAKVPSAVSRELPTRAAILRAQGDDEQARKRNRRIFGSLLGTLQKFKQEEIVLQTKEDKRAQVERKIEEQARLEKEREQKERKTLFAEREMKKSKIKALEAKMGRVQEFEKWEASQRHLSNFILTKAKPHLYWLPKKMTEKAEEKLASSRRFNEKCMQKKRDELQEELQRIEQRCLRPRPALPAAKENEPDLTHRPHLPHQPHQPEAGGPHQPHQPHGPHQAAPLEEEGPRKRDKFAMDADEKEDSDGDERPDTDVKKEDKETDESKVDTSMEVNTTGADDTKENLETTMETSTAEDTQTDVDMDKTAEPTDHS